MTGRVGRLEAGDVEHAHIHGGEGDIAGLAVGQPINVYGDIQRPARGGGFGGVDGDGELFVARGDLGVAEAERAGRVLARADVHRADHLRGDVSACAPVFGDRKGDGVLALGDLDGLAFDNVVGHHGDERGAGVARHDAQLGGVAGGVFGLVQRQLQRVGRVAGVGGGVPAGVEIGGG